jgi:hypothetical protein
MRSVRIFGLAGLMLLALSTSAQAWGWRFFYHSGYYGPVGVAYYYPVYQIPACYSTPVLPTQYAVPKSAPASQSQTGEPPLNTGKPSVTEQRSHSAKFASAKDDRCRVGFWNITGREVTIVVNGQSRSLARNQSLTLELARTFNWQMDGRQNSESVPDGQSTFDIVLRP